MNALRPPDDPHLDELACLRARVAELEATLAATEHAAHLESLLAHAPIGIALLDAEFRFRQINARLAAFNGLSVEAHLGRSIREVLPELAPILEPIYARIFATGEPVLDNEIVAATPAEPGVARVWRNSYFPVRALDGTLSGVGVVLQEITGQREAEQALHAERRQLEAIVNTMHEGVVAVRPDGTFALINPAALAMTAFAVEKPLAGMQELPRLQYQPSDADGHPLPVDLLPMQRVLRGERFVGLELCVGEAADGQNFWHLVNGTPVLDEQGNLALGVVTFQEITEQKRNEATLAAHAEALSRTNAELTRALRLKDEFLAMMSHELRTPLNAVLGISEGMMEQIYGPVDERQRHALAQVAESGRHLLSLLSDMLDLARIGVGAEQLEPERVNVELLCRNAQELVGGRARKKELRLMRSVSLGVEAVRADQRRLMQILVNLLDNAIKFTPAGGTVGLEVVGDAAREQIAFTVWDTGIGIAPEDLGQLFQPFTQLDRRLSRSYEGIGLGLTLVQRLTELHGGSVQLESAPGKGSRFTVTLPWSEADNVRPTEPVRPVTEPHWSHPPRILAADDHEPTLELYVAQLSRLGCTVMTARTGREAFEQIRTQRPEVVLLDIQMPELDGLSVIRQVRADAAVAATPIIAVTALAMPGDRQRCLDAGASAYLAKPVGVHTLVETIAEVLAGA